MNDLKRMAIASALLLIAIAAGGGCAEASRADLSNSRGDKFGRGTGSIGGEAYVIYAHVDKDTVKTFNSAGRVVRAIPVTPETRAWMTKFASQTDMTRAYQIYEDEEPDDMEEFTYSVYGWGHGQFEFTEMPAREYYLVFAVNAEVAHGIVIDKVVLEEGEVITERKVVRDLTKLGRN